MASSRKGGDSSQQRKSHTLDLEDQNDAVPSPEQNSRQASQDSGNTLTEEREVTGSGNIWQSVYNILSYTPRSCRYDPNAPVRFSLGLNILFGTDLFLSSVTSIRSILHYRSY